MYSGEEKGVDSGCRTVLCKTTIRPWLLDSFYRCGERQSSTPAFGQSGFPKRVPPLASPLPRRAQIVSSRVPNAQANSELQRRLDWIGRLSPAVHLRGRRRACVSSTTRLRASGPWHLAPEAKS